MSHQAVTLDQPESYFKILDQTAFQHWWARGVEKIERTWLQKAVNQSVSHQNEKWNWLDVGCGTGSRFRYWQNWGLWNQCVGIEPEESGLVISEKLQLENTQIFQGKLPGLGLTSSTFHLVTLFDVLQHVPFKQRRQSIAEVSNLLLPGGLLLLRTNAGGLAGKNRDDDSIVCRDFLAEVMAQNHLKIRRESHFNLAGSLADDFVTFCRRVILRSKPIKGPAKTGLPRQWNSKPDGRWPGKCAGLIESQIVANGVAKLPFGHSYIVLAIKDEHHG